MKNKIRFAVVNTTSAVPKMAVDLIARYPKELGHINPDDIQFAWRHSEKSRYHGKTHLIRGEEKMFTDKKVVIVLWMRSWKQHDPAWRLLLLYHEMRHVYPPKKKGGDYRILKHDVEDFSDLITKYGVKWEHASKFLDDFKKGR